MPRKARTISKTGIYHIMMRGVNRQNIFEDDEDCLRFLQTIHKYKEKSGYQLYAYCLMDNHVHILLKVNEESLAQVMRRICGSYVYWYNRKYDRIGNLFQDRFKSETVENDTYFLTVLRYIHQNPLKAGLCRSVAEYNWSSYYEYVNKARIVDVGFVLNMFNDDREKAIKYFIDYNNEKNNDKCLDLEKRRSITDEEARAIIIKVCRVTLPTDLQRFDIMRRNECLKKVKEEYNLSIRQIERLTGVNRGIISRV